jgi:hypothetical protein
MSQGEFLLEIKQITETLQQVTIDLIKSLDGIANDLEDTCRDGCDFLLKWYRYVF